MARPASESAQENIGDTLASPGWPVLLRLLTERVKTIRSTHLSNPTLPLEAYRANVKTLHEMHQLFDEFYTMGGDEMPVTLKALFK